MSQIHKQNRKAIKTYLIDATPVAVDINILKKYISKERLDKLKLKLGFSTTKKYYVGFKVTVVLDKDTLCPVSILIHDGSPNDSKIYEEILSELKRRRLLSKRNILYFDKGYYAMKNYQLGINQYKIVPVIFPKYENTAQKISDKLSYPLNIFFTKKGNKIKKEIKTLKKILLNKIRNWKEFKPIRGLIEDFFKVAKDTFGLGKFHKYTQQSTSKNIYICLLLTTICIQQGYNTKTKMQQLAEVNIELRPPIQHRRKKIQTKTKKTNNKSVPYQNKNNTLDKYLKNKPKTLLYYL